MADKPKPGCMLGCLSAVVVVLLLGVGLYGISSSFRGLMKELAERKGQDGTQLAGKQASASAPDVLKEPVLTGTPFEVLSAAKGWVDEFRRNVASGLRYSTSQIQNGGEPSKALADLRSRLDHNKLIIVSTNGVGLVLKRHEDKMRDQIKEVEKICSQPGIDSSIKQQYADTLTTARTNMDEFRSCEASVDILGKQVDSLNASVAQWKTFYETTSGVTGADAAKTKLISMVNDALAAWEKLQ